MHVDAFAQDDTCAQEADACHHLGGDTRRISRTDEPGEHDKASRAQGHQRVGAQARHLLVPLPLETDNATEQQGEGQTQGGIAQARQVDMHGLSYSLRYCRMMTVGR